MNKININSKDIKSSNLKKNIPSISFSRAFCSLGIVIFHYFEHTKGNYKRYFRTANADFGFILVTIFFNISGTVLFYNYDKIKSIAIFYYKRWKSILLSYYICNFYFFVTISLITHKLAFRGQYYHYLLILIGLDGYLCHGYYYNVYNLVGEWFLGAIIIIYLSYPLLIIIMNINFFIINYIIAINYYLMYKTKIFGVIDKRWNINTCFFSFYFGIFVVKFKYIFFYNNLVFILSFILLIILSVYKINTSFVLFQQVQGFTLYIILLRVGKFIMTTKLAKIFHTISGLSYSIFLYHHRIIRDILMIYNPIEFRSHLKLLGVTIVLILICSKIHLSVINYVLELKIFKLIEFAFN